MSCRPEWLEKFKVRNLNKNERGKRAVYIDREDKIVKATHFNLEGSSYSVPREEENNFLNEYVDFIFVKTRGKQALTENALVTDKGTCFTSLFVDLEFTYPSNSDGK